MKNAYYITFRSVTFAQRGERVLRKAGIRCSLQRTPRWMEAQGCGYALRLWTEDLEEVLVALQRERISMRKVYRQNQDGGMEELIQ